MAPYLFNYEIMLDAKRKGHKFYDLYGVSPAGDDKHKWAGISVFKRNLGGTYQYFGPALDLVYDQAGYEEYLHSLQR